MYTTYFKTFNSFSFIFFHKLFPTSEVKKALNQLLYSFTPMVKPHKPGFVSAWPTSKELVSCLETWRHPNKNEKDFVEFSNQKYLCLWYIQWPELKTYIFIQNMLGSSYIFQPKIFSLLMDQTICKTIHQLKKKSPDETVISSCKPYSVF